MPNGALDLITLIFKYAEYAKISTDSIQHYRNPILTHVWKCTDDYKMKLLDSSCMQQTH